ncbi:proton-coupled amino acid transporter-like protein pathetic isoform X1 [Planococcus citri]|uniref:proton-coupled amino acid transporter-like protein pathetic isoform X1 n=1 Tax=Planococcus citri TaxID=170843 RepID=UPI0031F749BA
MVKENNGGQPSEMDTFLSPDKQVTVDLLDDSTKITIRPAQKKELLNGNDYVNYDPFKTRNLQNATTDSETLTHLLKACLGSGILAMPSAFKNGGVVFGLFGTVIIGIICAHCAYILVKCAHKLYYRTRVSSLTFSEVGEVAFANGPRFSQKFAKPAKLCIVIGIFLTYFGTCCAYNVIIAGNLQQVIQFHGVGKTVDKRLFIAGLLIPLILLSYVPNLKALAICSQIANVLMGCTIGITLYYIFSGDPLHNPTQLPPIAETHELPEFFSLVIFAMECIGVIMPLENNMATPRHFLGKCGVMNKGMSFVTIVYMLLGFVGYLKYGNSVCSVITLNLPEHEIAAQCAKVFIAFAVFFTYGLQFYVCLDLIWNGIKDKISKNGMFYNYLIRTILVILSVAVAVAVPKISPFLTIVGALFFSALGLIFPVIIETVVFWEEGFGFLKWKLLKNVFIIVFGVLAMIFGTNSGIQDILRHN